MKNYLERPRSTYAAEASAEAWNSLRPGAAFLLPANNADARIAFAQIAVRHVLAHQGIRLGPVCFVTIAPDVCCLPIGDAVYPDRRFRLEARRIGPAANFDIRRLQGIAREALGGVPFIGMVEAALYYRWGPNGRSRRDWISWHCHLLTWGATRSALTKLLAPLRERYSSIRADLSVAHVQTVSDDDVARQLFYALKAPQKLYRVEQFRRPWTNPRTGERRPAGLHSQKDWLRTGNRVRLLDVIGDRTLDKLLFGNGAGTALVRSIRNEALSVYRTWEAGQLRAQRL